MKVIMYMAISVNGYIARENDNTDWPSPEDWDGFDKYSKEAGNIILGRRTFELCIRDDIFPWPERFNVIMTHKKIENKYGDDVLFTDKEPREIIKLLETKGFKTAFVGGGGHINSAFLKDGLVNEIYLDVEPIVLGKGIKLFADDDFEAKLEFLGVKNLNKNTTQLHYKVI